MKKKMILNGQPIEVAGSTGALEAGDGLSKESNTINVDNPVRGIYTQAEFEALTEEQKASGTYFVDDGTTCSCGEVYDGQERVIGTWFGNPLYRKCFVFENIGGSSEWAHLMDVNDLSIDLVVSYSGAYIHAADGAIKNFRDLGLRYYSGYLDVYTQGMSLTRLMFIIYYTKTTDQEVSA